MSIQWVYKQTGTPTHQPVLWSGSIYLTGRHHATDYVPRDITLHNHTNTLEYMCAATNYGTKAIHEAQAVLTTQTESLAGSFD